MSTVDILDIMAYSSLLPAITGMIRFGKIPRTYHPFIYILVLAEIFERAAEITVSKYHNGAMVTKWFILLEPVLWIWQFRLWNRPFRDSPGSLILPELLIVFWIIETALEGFDTYNSVFVVISSFITVFIAVNQANKLIVEEKNNLLINAKFVICVSIIIFSTYHIFTESFFIFNLEQSITFMTNIFFIMGLVNLFVNLLYTYAILWIPTRQKFSLAS